MASKVGARFGSLILGKLLGEGSMEVGGELDEDDEVLLTEVFICVMDPASLSIIGSSSFNEDPIPPETLELEEDEDINVAIIRSILWTYHSERDCWYDSVLFKRAGRYGPWKRATSSWIRDDRQGKKLGSNLEKGLSKKHLVSTKATKSSTMDGVDDVGK
ncbi:hypothetical protein V6N13_115075 [Hibiscus sabdariffa]|uniref:Uncharacterized protein n=1 Tax=Hibiscus sabdariffa TaxID=183260 RepID=A0ABR2U3U2_9ROSI